MSVIVCYVLFVSMCSCLFLRVLPQAPAKMTAYGRVVPNVFQYISMHPGEMMQTDTG